MHGYKEDEYGNFHPVDVPEDPEHRAQGIGDVLANIFTGGIYGAVKEGADTASAIEAQAAAQAAAANRALPGTLAHATRGWVTPGQPQIPGGPNFPAGTPIHSDSDPNRRAQYGSWKSGNWYRVTVDSMPSGANFSWFWIPLNYFIDSKTGQAGGGGGVSTAGASQQTQAVLQAIGNGASVQSFPDGSIRVTGTMPGAHGSITWSINKDGSGKFKPTGGNWNQLGPGTYQTAMILAASRGGSGGATAGGGTITVMQKQNVYDSPSPSARVVGTIGPGPIHVPVLQRQSGWVKTTPPGWNRSGWIQFGAGVGAQAVFGTPVQPTAPTLSGIAAPSFITTPSGIPGVPVAAPMYGAPAVYGAPAIYPRRHHRPLPFDVPVAPVGGIDPAILQILLQEAQAQGAQQATLQALLAQLQSGANFGPAVQGSGLDLLSILSGAGVKLDAAGLPVPAGYMGTDQAGADIYGDGGVDPTGGALGDYTDPRSQY